MRRAPKYCANRDCMELLPAGTTRCPDHTIRWANTRRRPPGWKATRLRILARDKWRCYVCGQHATEVDHIDNLGSESDDNLAAICPACHRRKSQSEAKESQLTRLPI